MSQSIRISDALYEEATTTASFMGRSLAQQVEHWAEIGRLMEETRSVEFMVINKKLKNQFKRDVQNVLDGKIKSSSLSIFTPEIVKKCVVEFPEIDFERLNNDYT